MDRQLQTITKDGKRFLLIEPGEYRRLARLAAAVRRNPVDGPPLPAPDRNGNVPAVAFARAVIARDIIRDRRAAGLTQAELARRAGVRVETLNRIEKGRHTPDTATIVKIDRALKRASVKPRSHRRHRTR